MKKKVLASLLCASMVATMVAGCGSSDDKKGTESAKSDSGKTTITVMGPSEDLDDAQGAWLKTECEAFAKEHTEWDIDFEYVTTSESEAKDVVTKDPKAAADVYLFANDQIEALVKAKALAKLGGETAEYVKSSNSEAMAATVTYDGEIYAVPYTSNTWFMYYDKRVFSEDDVKSLDTMLTKGKVSFPFDNGWYLNAFYAANGCTIYGDGTDKAAGYDFSGDKATAVTNYIVDLFANPNFVMDNNDGSLGLAGLKDGSINAYFNGNWNYQAVKDAIGEENVGVAALPTVNIGGKACQLKAFLGSKAVGVNPNCANQEIAVKLAAYLGSEDAQLSHFKLRGQSPVNTNLTTNSEVAADPVAAAMAEVATNCSVAQPIIDMQGYWDAATPFGDSFVNGAEGQITHDNAAEKTEAFNTQLADSLK
ncbi:MAG: extracellular solute-binding protein [Agathobacter sp.]|uniref:extracellular solute-binding protein n=1 Tax=Agathobacter sp. TaxID=2021311 RepID=UPI003993B817